MRKYLAHPLTRSLEIDSPETTGLRRTIIREKVFLRRIYEEWYRDLLSELPEGEGKILEIGAGAGFIREMYPEVLTSELLAIPGVSVVLDALQMPIRRASLRGIIMTNVLHHLPQPRVFFAEAARCTRPGGVLAMVEPWATTWSGWVYRHMHHEPFDPHRPEWNFPSSGPLSGANGALPWIIFNRDRQQFERDFPQWEIVRIHPTMPLRYMLSGGVGYRPSMPAWTFQLWRTLETGMGSWMSRAAMFAYICLKRRTVGTDSNDY
jgi:SAM-dependent methyltransferase